jgi:hypothetical protein
MSINNINTISSTACGDYNSLYANKIYTTTSIANATTNVYAIYDDSIGNNVYCDWHYYTPAATYYNTL